MRSESLHDERSSDNRPAATASSRRPPEQCGRRHAGVRRGGRWFGERREALQKVDHNAGHQHQRGRRPERRVVVAAEGAGEQPELAA